MTESPMWMSNRHSCSRIHRFHLGTENPSCKAGFGMEAGCKWRIGKDQILESAMNRIQCRENTASMLGRFQCQEWENRIKLAYLLQDSSGIL